MGESCQFCRIGSLQEPVHIVCEDATFLGFLDSRPLFPGHCLLIPKQHFETLVDLPDDLIGPLFRWTKVLAAAVEQGLGVDGTLVAINNRVSQSVPHLHVHVVPRRFKDGLRGFFWPRNPYRDQRHLLETQRAIAEAVEKLQESAGL
ncbi:MAG TPA: HIT family protein [Acidobacteriota bacterium]|nr:HIT family protein [Acidobacteriota bacterium]